MKLITNISILFLSYTLSAQTIGLKDQYVAGDQIVFTYPSQENLKLLIQHSYGTTLFEGEISNGQLRFIIPSVISIKKGVIDFTLLSNGLVRWKGSTQIIPHTQGDRSIEAYCGPKHLVVNKNDFSMLTASVLDMYDNAFPKETTLCIHSLIDQTTRLDSSQMNGLIAYERISASNRSGYGAVSSSYEDTSSKEFRLDFYANDPEAFQLFFDRQHTYADGNQLVHFKTSVLKDRNDNIVENGTLLNFDITDDSNRKTLAYASTIDGVASFDIPAPDYPTSWTVRASVPTYALSNVLQIPFKASILEIPVKLTNEELIVGPLKGFMNQHVREGLLVSIQLEKDSKVQHYQIPTQNGIATLNFKNQLIFSGSYNAEIQVSGRSKKIKINVKNE